MFRIIASIFLMSRGTFFKVALLAAVVRPASLEVAVVPVPVFSPGLRGVVLLVSVEFKSGFLVKVEFKSVRSLEAPLEVSPPAALAVPTVPVLVFEVPRAVDAPPVRPSLDELPSLLMPGFCSSVLSPKREVEFWRVVPARVAEVSFVSFCAERNVLFNPVFPAIRDPPIELFRVDFVATVALPVAAAAVVPVFVSLDYLSSLSCAYFSLILSAFETRRE